MRQRAVAVGELRFAFVELAFAREEPLHFALALPKRAFAFVELALVLHKRRLARIGIARARFELRRLRLDPFASIIELGAELFERRRSSVQLRREDLVHSFALAEIGAFARKLFAIRLHLS